MSKIKILHFAPYIIKYIFKNTVFYVLLPTFKLADDIELFSL